MKQISNMEYEKYQQYLTDKLHGRILTPDGLRVVCAGLDNDSEKISIPTCWRCWQSSGMKESWNENTQSPEQEQSGDRVSLFRMSK